MRAGLPQGEFPEKRVGGWMSGVGVSMPSDASANEELARAGWGCGKAISGPRGRGPGPFSETDCLREGGVV